MNKIHLSSLVLAFLLVTPSLALLFVRNGHAQPGPIGDAGGQSASYRLVGTIGGNALAGAVVSDGKGEQTFIRLHEKLPDGSQLVGVRDDSISIKGSDGTRYDMFISHEAPKSSTSAKPVADARPAPPADPYSGVTPVPAGHPSAVTQQPVKRARPGRSGRAGSATE